MKKFVMLLFLVIFSINLVSASTYYMATTGTDGAGVSGDATHPWHTLQYSFTRMSGGDSLIIKDGTYTGSANAINDNYKPPNGSAGAFTTIRAENDGETVFDGDNVRNMMEIGWGGIHYVKFVGIIWKNALGDNLIQAHDGQDASYRPTYIYFSKCGFYDSGVSQSGSYIGLDIRRSDYVLVEDCYFWGEMYYGIKFELNTHSIMRRCVSRIDIHRGTYGSGITLYSSNDCEQQNCIVIDSDSTSTYSNFNHMSAYEYPTTDGPSYNIYARGCMALNLKTPGGDFFTGMISKNGAPYNMFFSDCVYWDTPIGFWDRSSEDDINKGSIYTHCLFGDLATNAGWGALVQGQSLTNSIILDSLNQYGFYNSNHATSDYNSYYGNTANYLTSANRGAHDYCTENNNAINPRTNSLLYLLRVEPGSALSNKGSDGGRIGPNIMYEIGGTGTFYGDPGYNTESNVPLWPFPNEDIIKAKFSSYTGNVHGSVNGKRGFCADGNGLYGGPITLTSYIWEYLGNPCPADICNYNIQYHPADTNQNNIIEMRELISFIGLWKASQANLSDVMIALDRWLRGA